MVLWVAIAGLLVWISFEFYLRGSGERPWRGRADIGRSTQILVGAYAVALAVTAVLGLSHLGVAPAPLRWVGCAVLLAGLALRAWSMVLLGSSYSRRLGVAARQALVTTGPYRVIRHPGYAGSLLVWLGFTLGAGTSIGALLVTIVLGAAYLYRMDTEERMLETEFGEPYRTYRQQTRRLIPGIY